MFRFSLTLLALAAAFPLTASLSMAQDFNFESVRRLAAEKAAVPYAAPADNLADFWKNLTYDQHRDIRFKMEAGLWAMDQKPFSIDFFHPGWTAKKSVMLNEVTGAEAKPLLFDRSLFDYGKQQVPNGIPSPPGYAGWRARTHLNSPDYMDEFLVFLGASYFRSIPAKAPYGLSARGISLNSGLPGVPEEFPDFQTFWLKQPEAGSASLTAWALLDGPSVAGAYQFTVTPGVETVMEIEAEITLRQPVKQLGLAPFSSMFWFGELTHPRAYDFRPEVHDSDGLLMELSTGARHFRPLDHTPDQFRHCVFSLDKPKSWSLLQRDRAFSSYQDVEAHYHDRPGARVEPLQGFDKGRLHLIEMPTADETNDNVILVWEPEPAPEVGKPYRFKYRLIWLRDPAPSGLFTVRATRYGHPVQKPDQLLFTIDFTKPLHPEKKTGDPKWDDISKFKPVVTTSNPDIKLIHADITDLSMANVDELPLGMGRNPEVHMPQVLRAFFVLEPPPGVRDIDMTCELRNGDGAAVSERWLYLWKKP
ncbi:MAG: glucan biosynthesis protein [Verrucomicrobiota bacterium]